MPLAIYDYVQSNRLGQANVLALLSIGLVVVLLLALGRLARLRY